MNKSETERNEAIGCRTFFKTKNVAQDPAKTYILLMKGQEKIVIFKKFWLSEKHYETAKLVKIYKGKRLYYSSFSFKLSTYIDSMRLVGKLLDYDKDLTLKKD